MEDKILLSILFIVFSYQDFGIIFNGAGRNTTDTELTTVTRLNIGIWTFLDTCVGVGTSTGVVVFGGKKHVISRIFVILYKTYNKLIYNLDYNNNK